MDPIGAYLLVSHAWGHPLAPWGSIDGKPILDTAGDTMTDVTAAALVAAGIGAEDGPDIAEHLMVLGEKLGVKLDGTYEGDVASILEALYERISGIEDSIKRLEDRT